MEATNTSQQQCYVYADGEVSEAGLYYYWLQSADLDGSSNFYGPISFQYAGPGGDANPEIPLVTELQRAFPNPFNPSTRIGYSLKERGEVLLQIYNNRGQLVREYRQQHASPGYYHQTWDGRDASDTPVSSGIYLYRMKAGAYQSVKRMTLIK